MDNDKELSAALLPGDPSGHAKTEALPNVGEARERLNTQLRCMADEIRAWGTVVDAKVDAAIDDLIVASALTERGRLAELIDCALDAAKARLEEDGCDCGDQNDPPCALCLVDAAIALNQVGSGTQSTNDHSDPTRRSAAHE